jgi:hypothetical protein
MCPGLDPKKYGKPIHTGSLYSRHESFNRLPQSIKILVDNEKSFKVSLKRFLYHSFYSMQEYGKQMNSLSHWQLYV